MEGTVESAPVSVSIQRPPGTPLGSIMNEIRTWLDAQKIQPLEFRQTVGRDGIGFDIRFRDPAEAERFRNAF